MNAMTPQAIRWRITKSSTDAERTELMSHCISGDLFGSKEEEYSTALLNTMLLPTTG